MFAASVLARTSHERTRDSNFREVASNRSSTPSASAKKRERQADPCSPTTGGHKDHILNAGERYVPGASGSIVIEAIGESQVNIIENA